MNPLPIDQSLYRLVAEAYDQSPLEPTPRLGEVLDDRHPALPGRVLTRVHGVEEAQWLPVVRGACARPGDRVLVTSVVGVDEAVVVAVLDGLEPPGEAAVTPAPLALRCDEVVQIHDAMGRPLLEVTAGPTGPQMRLLGDGLTLKTRGTLRLVADALELEATAGHVDIDAAADVHVRGEVIHLG